MAEKADKEIGAKTVTTDKGAAPKPSTNSSPRYKIGDIVKFTGCIHYTSSYANGIAKACKAGLATITSINKGNPHPYKLQAVVGKGATVYGWVNAKDIAGLASSKRQKASSVKFGDAPNKAAKKSGTTEEK